MGKFIIGYLITVNQIAIYGFITYFLITTITTSSNKKVEQCS